ncbi:MAG: hypothetical protein FIA92_08200 [Chloroflexi bacterium]|nr:hypothetical protein [Chloroflexota bacterium]
MGRSQSQNDRASMMVAAVILAIAAGACGTGDGTSPPGAGTAPPADGGGATVAVTLQEWAVVPDTISTASGDVTFTVTNAGPEDEHELVIVRTDLDPGALPTDETGAVVETGEGIEVVDEVEEIPVGGSEELTATLEPGAYVLLCNIYSAEENEAHYQLGMRTAFSVE